MTNSYKPTPFRVALIQFTASRDPEANIGPVSALIRSARAEGAQLICTPENTGFMEPDAKALIEKAELEDSHHSLAAYRNLAAETGAWLVIGSLAVKKPTEKRVANRSYLVDPTGSIAASYDKIHLFDVDLPNGESYRESRTFSPGGRAVIADLPWGQLGMSICYDLRFAYYYRLLAQSGAHFLTVPAAFTVPTGKAHWHVLLRARAIEAGCYVFAPAQTGIHAEGRETYGHSLIVAPWGEVLADGGELPGIVSAEIDPAAVAKARIAVPALNHDRSYKAPGVGL
jgi:predicted amidohydrolase